MIAQCWLHIGVEKTGTTSIQEFLARNRPTLLKAGFLYPLAPGRTNHIGLTCYALEDQKPDSLRRSLGIASQAQLERYRSRLLVKIDREIDRSQARNLVLSNEHLSSRLQTSAEIERIKRFCDRIASRTTVVVYLRNQVDFLVSRYIEAVKGGSTNPFSFRPTSAVSRKIDYAWMLAPWRKTFGAENLVVRRFEQSDFHDGDLLLDFASVCGFDGRSLEAVPRHNVALDALCVEFLREFNRHVPHMIGGRRNPLRANLIHFLENAGTGEPFSVSRETAAAIEEHFADANGAVSALYFGDAPLFSPSRKSAPVASGPIGSDDSIRIAAHLWQAQQAELSPYGITRGDMPAGAAAAGRQSWKQLLSAHWASVAGWLPSKTQRGSVRSG